MSVLEITSENFEKEVLESEKTVLVDMYATWCGPCKMQSPIIDKIAEEQEGKVKVTKIDIDEAPEIAEKYGVMSIPTLLIIKNGEVAKQFVGLTKKEDIEASL